MLSKRTWRKERRPPTSSSPLLMGVPVTAHRLTERRCLAICAALVVAPSIICASSTMTRHHWRRVSGVGKTGYLPARPVRPEGAPASKCTSRRSTSNVVSTMSASAKSAAVTTMPTCAHMQFVLPDAAALR